MENIYLLTLIVISKSEIYKNICISDSYYKIIEYCNKKYEGIQICNDEDVKELKQSMSFGSKLLYIQMFNKQNNTII